MSSVVSAAPLGVDSIVKLTTGEGPVWSPDGTEVSYSRDGTIYKMALADQIEIELAAGYGGRWSPDGNQMIYQKRNDNRVYNLWIMNEDGSSQKQISNKSGRIDSFAWSPDGSKIAYTDVTGLTLIEPDGSNKQVIYHLGVSGIAWSPDSSKLVFPEYIINEDNIAQLKVINSDGTNLMNLDAFGNVLTFGPQTQSWQSQVWSPDGSKIVYDSYYYYGQGGSVLTVNSDGSGVNRLANEISERPCFSPDGSKIVYSYTDLHFSNSYEERDIWIMDADGSNKTPLTTSSLDSSAYNPVWSPDGTKIAFASVNRDESYISSIWIINLKELSGNNSVITVDDDGGADYNTIQAAVDAAKYGDTILVSPGTYNENVNVYKPVIIESTNGAEVTNVVGTSNYPVFYVTAYKSTIKGFSISDGDEAYYGIYLSESDYNTITENIITSEKSSRGIELYSSEHNTINNNKVSGGSFAAISVYGNENTVINNNVSATKYGISLNGNNNVLSNNEAQGSENGVHVYGDDNTLNYNKIYSSNFGIRIYSSSGSTVSNNIIEARSVGISMEHSENITLDSNSLNTTGNGVILSNASNNLIFNNFFNASANVEFERTNTGNQWNIEKKAGTNIIGGSYIAGNYWATPDGTGFSQTGFDVNSDGICDSVYVLDSENIDYLPLNANVVNIPGYPRTLTVDDSGEANYTSIQAAVDAAILGESILVSPGTYNENVDVDKQLTITSEDGASVTNVISTSSEDHVFEVLANGVTISGFSISTATGAEKGGIYLNSDGNKLTDNKLENNYIGIYLNHSNNNELTSNILANNDYMGIFVYSCSNNILRRNTVSHSGHGILLSGGGNNNTLTDNTVLGHSQGITLDPSNNNMVTNNTISNSSRAIYIDRTHGNTLTNNKLSDNEYGIYMVYSNCTIISNTVSDNYYGIYMIYSDGNTIYDNLLNNTVNAVFERTNSDNVWNTEKTAGENIVGGPYLGGNYWAKPDGTGFSQNAVDTNGDGISESPYELDADNIDYLPLTDNEPSLPPSPEITSVVVEPSNLHQRGIATIKISVKNNGGPSNLGFIAVSFPDNEDIIEVSGTGSNENKLFPVGSSLVTSTSSTITAINPLVQLYDENWDSGQTETLTIKVKVNEGASELKFYVRATLREKDAANYIRTPASSSITDQQGFYVDEHSVDVTSQVLTATITSITPYPATEGTTVSFSGTGTAAYGEIVGYKWSSSIDNELSSSASFSTSNLSVGTHTIDFSVKDDDGTWSDADTETLVIAEAPNQVPTASITSISPNPVIEGNIVFFSGSGNDTDGTIADYNWESSSDGNLSNSASFSTADLTVGTHTIYFSVCDNNGEWSSKVSKSLTVNKAPAQTGNDSAPVLVSVSPTSGSTLAAGTTSVNVLFNYNDTETGVNTNSVIFIFDYIDVTDDGNVTITSTSAQYNATGLEAGSHSAFVYVADNAGNLASFNTSFTIAEKSSSSSSSGSSSGGGGGGGGGGSTGETYANIAVKEVDSVFVNKGSHVVYGFNNEGNAISMIEFDSKKNSGSIQTIVEVLKDTSALVDADAPGEIYQHMNIWVGKVGFATENNVENMLITFKVERSWLNDSNVPAESVILYRYSDNIWNKLPTTITREDDEYVYFETETPGFSPFAISGESEDVVMSVPDEGAEAVVEEPSEVETSPKGINTTGIFLMLGLISAVFVGGYILYRKQS